MVLSLPAAAEGSENVYTLTLTFDSGKVLSAKLGRIRGSVLGGSATIRYANPETTAWRHAAKVNVFAALPGENTLTVDGGDATTVAGAGYHAWYCPDRQTHELVLAVDEDETYEATLRLTKGFVFTFR